jgi:hypothetical protein
MALAINELFQHCGLFLRKLTNIEGRCECPFGLISSSTCDDQSASQAALWKFHNSQAIYHTIELASTRFVQESGI